VVFQNGPQRVYVDLDYTPLVARFYPDKETYLLKTTAGIPIRPTQCLMDEKGQIVFTAQIEVQYAPTTNETLFFKKTKEVHVLLHDHDLGIFSETAEIQHACGLLGHWNWQGQKIAVESAISTDIKKFIAPYPDLLALDDITLVSVLREHQSLKIDKNRHRQQLLQTSFALAPQPKHHQQHTSLPCLHAGEQSCQIAHRPWIKAPTTQNHLGTT